MSDAVDAAQPLGIKMDQFTRPLALIANNRRFGIKRREPAKPNPAKHLANCRCRAADPARDCGARQTLTPQSLDLSLLNGSKPRWR